MVDDKEHLFDKDEYQRQIKKEMAKLNSQQFANAGPGGLGPEITTVGLKTNIEPISQKFLDVGFAVQDYGTIGFVSQIIDFDFLGAQYNIFKLNGDVTFGFQDFPINRAQVFTVDITIDTGTPPVIIWPSSVKNLPINLPTADGSRYILHMVGYRNDNEEVYHVIGGSTGSILPVGTAENQHLEWDNTGLKWDAVQSSEYGATGPHADSGFLRFANDNIMTSQRNALDDGNLEFKVTTLDEFDFTNSLNGTVVDLVLRAQQSPQPNAKFIIRQNPDDGSDGDITSFIYPEIILFVRGAIDQLRIGPAEIDILTTILDMNLGDIKDITELRGRDDATPFKIIFDANEDSDTFISDDTTTADRINVTVGGSAIFSWAAGAPNQFGVPTGETAVLVMANNPIEDVAGIFPQDNGLDDIGTLTQSFNQVFQDGIHFVHSTVSVADERMISFEGSGNMEINVPTGDSIILRVQGTDEYLFNPTSFQLKNLNQLHFLDISDNQDIKISYIDPVFLIDLSGSSTQFKINNAATIPDFVLEGENTGATFLAHNLRFDGKSSTGVNREYGDIKVRQIVSTNTSEDGGMEFELIEAGTPNVTYLQLNAQLLQVRILKELNLNNNEITGVDFMNFNERVGDPTVGANEGVLYVKDVSTNSHLFFDNSTESPVDLTVAITPITTMKTSVRIATQVNDTLSGLAARDGVTPVAGDRVLVKAQTTASANGIYTAASGAWTRATDYDTDVDATSGSLMLVQEGTVNDNKAFQLTTNEPITLGTTSLTFTEFGAGGGGNEFSDALFRVFDNIDDTRKLAFQTGGIATGTTRTWTVPNRDGTIVVIDGTTGDLEVVADINVTDFDVLNIKDLVGRDAGLNSFRIIFDGAEDSDTYFGDSGSLDRINVFAGANNIMFWLPTEIIITNTPLRFQGDTSLVDSNTFDIGQVDGWVSGQGVTSRDVLDINAGSTANGLVVSLSGENDEWYLFTDEIFYVGTDASGATDGHAAAFFRTFPSNFSLTDIPDGWSAVFRDQADNVLKVKKNISGVFTTVSLEGAGGSGANVTLSNLSVTSINQDLRPSATGVRDLGLITLRWKDIFGEDLDIKSTFKTGEDETASNTVSFFGATTNLTHHNVAFVVDGESLSLTQIKVALLQTALDDHNLVGAF